MSNNKIGFNYYSVDTDRYQDMKIKRLKKEFACSGIAVYDYILCEIYRVKGCFIKWDESTVFDVADYFGLKETVVNEIVNYCCYVGLFDKELLTTERVLSSASIQSRYIDWSKKAKRINFKIPVKYYIIPEEPIKIPEETIQTSRSLPQSKVTENKVNESTLTHARNVSVFFGISEVSQAKVFFKIVAFVEFLEKKEKLVLFLNQFEFYKKLKDESSQEVHRIGNFTGTFENDFDDGKWNSENWEHQYNLYKTKSNNGFNSKDNQSRKNAHSGGKKDFSRFNASSGS